MTICLPFLFFRLISMITNAQVKTITALKEKKFRERSGLFVVEGRKMTQELIKSDYEIEQIFACKEWIEDNKILVASLNKIANLVVEVADRELSRISSLSTADRVICIVKQRKTNEVEWQTNEKKLVLALDDINNPGNLGTIIRMALWFGVKDIVCSKDTVDCYNPKTLQSTMGAIFHVNISYTDLTEFLFKNQKRNIYGTVLLNGKNIYKQQLQNDGIIVIGSESHGISDKVKRFVNNPITIPCFAPSNEVESLNASVACGIILSEFRRTIF